jgi:hypothetical protein
MLQAVYQGILCRTTLSEKTQLDFSVYEPLRLAVMFLSFGTSRESYTSLKRVSWI